MNEEYNRLNLAEGRTDQAIESLKMAAVLLVQATATGELSGSKSVVFQRAIKSFHESVRHAKNMRRAIKQQRGVNRRKRLGVTEE